MEILLNKFTNKQSRNVNNFLATNLIGDKKILPQTQFLDKINEVDLYMQEREACNIIRLNCVINPICSNVLFNSISEIVKNEGDPNFVKVLNYGEVNGFINDSDFINKIYCKTPIIFTKKTNQEGIRDTQLSTEKCGFKYNCGLDIFNNHIIRNNTFKTVCYNYHTTLIYNNNISINPLSVFNTINDLMRDENGEYIQGDDYESKKLLIQHLYTTDDVMSFKDTVNEKLIEKNGWFGFTNVGKFAVVDNNNEPMDIFRVINYRRSCDFIQMYPTSDLWSFTPKYNSYLHRLEKNWNYCLTYPSSSTTKNISFIRENTNSLKIMYADDRIKLKSGVKGIKIYSISKHGLQKGDYINFYSNDDIIMENCEVREIENDYIFYIFNNGIQLYKRTYELTQADVETSGIDDFYVTTSVPLQDYHFKYDSNIIINNSFTADTSGITKTMIDIDTNYPWETFPFHGKTYKLNFSSTIKNDEINVKEKDIKYELLINTEKEGCYKYTIQNIVVDMPMQYIISNDRKKVYCGDGDDRQTYYLINNKFVNIDDDAQDFSFKKVVDGEEVKYYVRIFSRLPNWKGCEQSIDEHKLYESNSYLIAKYQTEKNDFESHISQLSFAKNIYGDDISQIVYSDDIDISFLKDNLGRPLTSIYLTILKNNKGYKEWYGKNGSDILIRKHPQDNDENYHIEYSHCFGMLNCAFRLSKESLPNIKHNNSMQINNIDSSFQYQGLDVEDIQHSNGVYENIIIDEDIKWQNSENDKQRSYRSRFKYILNDEIQYGYYYDYETQLEYYGDTHFYGDLCAFSQKRVLEVPIQQIEMRFNTAQREISSLDKSYDYFKTLYYDEILTDDKDTKGFVSQENAILNAHQHKEGYCYHPHYEIPIKTFEKNIISRPSITLTLTNIQAVSNEQERAMRFKMRTLNPHNLQKHNTVYIKYDTFDIENTYVYKTDYYVGFVSDIINPNVFECIIYNESNQRVNALNTLNITAYRLFKKDSTTPDYATFTKDGSCHFVWRNVINNGLDNNSNIENYPFFNGAFYVNKQINLFVKRQDPSNDTQLQTSYFLLDVKSNPLKNENGDNYNTDNYYEEKDMSC